MKLRGLLLNVCIGSVGLVAAARIAAQQLRLHLRHGEYVHESIPCNNPPFAAMMSWNGIGFSGPHSAQCRSRVLTHSGNRYDISTACAALGDDTPDASAYVDTFTVTRLSESRFKLTKAGNPAGTYRWCSALVPTATR